MTKASIICTALSLCILPSAHAADTQSSNITLRIPERLVAEPVSVVEHTTSAGNGGSINAHFCVSGSDGLQFSIVSDDRELSTSLEFDASQNAKDQTKTLHNSVIECHEQDFGVLRITQLPQGRQSVTAVVVIE